MSTPRVLSRTEVVGFAAHAADAYGLRQGGDHCGWCKQVAFVAAVFLLLAAYPVAANSVTFDLANSSLSIMGAEDDENEFRPDTMATFTKTESNKIELLLTYEGGNQTLESIQGMLTGVTWDMETFAGTIDPISATIPSGSTQVGVDADTTEVDISDHWAFKDDIEAGSGRIGRYGFGAIGDINSGADTFGAGDLINSSGDSNDPNGIDYGLVPDDVDLTKDGFKTQGPAVQNEVLLTFETSGDSFELSDISNVEGLYGSDGMLTTPTPSAAVIGLTSFLLLGLRRGQRRGEHKRTA